VPSKSTVSRVSEAFAEEPMLARHWLLAAAAHGHKDALDRVNWAVATTQRPKMEQKWIDLMEEHGWI